MGKSMVSGFDFPLNQSSGSLCAICLGNMEINSPKPALFDHLLTINPSISEWNHHFFQHRSHGARVARRKRMRRMFIGISLRKIINIMEKVTDSCGFYMGFRFCCGLMKSLVGFLLTLRSLMIVSSWGKEVRNCEVGNRLNSAWHDHQSIGIHIYQLCLHMLAPMAGMTKNPMTSCHFLWPAIILESYQKIQ